jgi:type IV secretory pathway VirB4 component
MLDNLYSIYNNPNEHLIQKSRVADEQGHIKEISSFDFNAMRSMGLSIRDLLAPSSVCIQKDYLMLGRKLARTLWVTELPSQISDEVLTNLTDMDFNCLTTLNFREIETGQAAAIVGRNLALVRDAKTKQIKAGQRQGIYDDSFVDPKLLEREEEALKMKDAMHQNDEKLFHTLITVVVFADTVEKLDEYTSILMTAYKKASMKLEVMANRQEEGFNATLPLCYNQIKESRTLTSSAVAGFIPFSTLELYEPGGINYSCNLISKNLIVYNRLSSANFNGFILGTPGSGKSFAAKTSMINVFLSSNSDIIVIDPEDEYGALARLLGGEVIRITPGGEYHINPLEITGGYELEDESNPMNAKADFVLKIVECINKSPFGMNSVQETIVDECVHQLFAPFTRNGALGLIPDGRMPTLTDLQLLLAKRREPEAREIAMALKLYSGTGSLNTFGSQTNVQTHSRFVVYQIRDIGDRLKNLAMLTILDHIWNQIVANRKLGKNTWFFVDEIYLLFQNEYSASFLNTLFRRARKYGGVPTGLTQNVSPLLESPTARDMLQNCCFIQILNQAGPDRERLKELLNLSDTQAEYITSSPKGQGLLYTGKNTVPFYSSFPKDNDIYRCLTSDLKEIKAYEMQEKREKSRKQKEGIHDKYRN